ncbi:putative pescadillo [Blattamonas nauphoetae]|uniref:Pescadillo n=1 Tax=Blattamonas nauphoetae TaxID=2049346 RepID=A0ABQ9Y998_9EUKA|nr:putative pescadillo [Blattamonas nauphoetae]
MGLEPTTSASGGQRTIHCTTEPSTSGKNRLLCMWSNVSSMGKVTAKKPKYIPRSQAVRKLHVSDRLFKRLCILNGIFPRVPNQAMKDKSKVYYHVNDIKYLARSPVLEKLRAKKISTKRIRRTLRSGDQEHADRLKKIAPKIPISFVLKERYHFFNYSS